MEQYILITTLVVALVELARRAEARDWKAVVTIIGSGLIGAIVGYFGIQGANVPDGIVVGLGASGLVTLATRPSGKSIVRNPS